MTLLESAIEYTKRGWKIFPCRPRLKEPYTSHGCRDATDDIQTIKAWWERWPDANIGLLCGPESGVYVVDIDYDKDKGEDGWKSLEALEVDGNKLPLTVMQVTPRGGAHFLFKANVPPFNKNKFADGIDIRSDGYYILLAPSIHPNGKVYEWGQGQSPDDIELAEYPDFMRPVKSKPDMPWLDDNDTVITPRQKPEASVTDRAIAYLRECPPAVQGQNGHDKLLYAARALVVGFLLDDNTAYNLLANDYNPRCCPPWDLSNSKDKKDFTRKITQARKTSNEKPAGWLLNGTINTIDEVVVSQGKAIADKLLKKKKSQVKCEIEINEEIPKFLLEPVGLVGDICSWINGTSRKPQPLLALANTLAFCGALFGRKVRDEWDTRTNIYAIGVAPSCSGKDHSRSQIKKLVSASGISSSLMGGEDVTSDAALEATLENNPSLLFQWDEVGHLLKAIKSSLGNPHMSKIVPTLMKLYSAANDTYYGKEYATGERRDIEQPCCCVYGTTVPSTLWQGLSTSELRDGWLGRCMTFITTTDPETNYEQAKVKDVPKHLIERVQAWHHRDIINPNKGDIASVVGCWQITIPHTPEAYEYIVNFEKKTRKKRQMEKDEGIGALWGRLSENAAKIALIVAAGDRFDNAEITLEHAIYGCSLAEYLLKAMIVEIERNISDSVAEGDKKAILEMIRKSGADGISRVDLTRRTQKYGRKQRNDYLDDLVEANRISYGQNSSKGNRLWYWYSGFIE